MPSHGPPTGESLYGTHCCRLKSTEMEVLIYLIPIALGLSMIGLVAFLWALRSGQFDDLDGAAHRILQDDDLPEDERDT